MQGARAVQQSIIRSFPHPEVSVGIVWVNMLPLDNKVTASIMALTMRAACVRHFHDPDKLAGNVIARSLGAPGKVAWDIYLFYPKGIEWKESPPSPVIWAHQLSPSSWADPSRYYRREKLTEELHRAMDQLTSLSGMPIVS